MVASMTLTLSLQSCNMFEAFLAWGLVRWAELRYTLLFPSFLAHRVHLRMLHHSFPNTWSISPRVVDFRGSKTPRTLTYLWARWFADVGLILLGMSVSCSSHKTGWDKKNAAAAAKETDWIWFELFDWRRFPVGSMYQGWKWNIPHVYILSPHYSGLENGRLCILPSIF